MASLRRPGSAERVVRQRLEQDGASGSSGCMGRRRRQLQGKAQRQQQEKSEPQREQGKGPSHRWQQGKAAADREGGSLVRSGDWICGGGGFGVESRGCGGRKPSPTLPFTVVSWATTQMERQPTSHLPPDKAQHPHLPPDKGPMPPLTTRQGSFMILLFHSYTIVDLIVKEL
jgi:hypothetical protein